MSITCNVDYVIKVYLWVYLLHFKILHDIYIYLYISVLIFSFNNDYI